ncbi:TIGR03757 family integrating conjugative element protein [Gallibacterium anatis]|uniref:TIGR03757 family integrating conjugative element protein n=1 Tax=Gallibacterium anatis TaxID=750 RepID=A0AAX3XH39_9PAST|nr:TIGR03757 family integrating conjugative element protein [Gallibacterium anatis]MDK9431180.1 TIGR03757 family integrating conjugative element protein [Gallibacterium anatis]WIM80725.1 TIGR03757 family integrating conjugative element protein [Gallibacterium anatis]
MIKRTLLLCLGISIAAWAELPSEVNITVFSTQAYPIQNAQLAQHLYHIDRVEQWEDALSQTLSSNPTQAESQAKAFFQHPDSQTKIRELQQAYQGVIIGWQMGIRKVPAVLFDSPQFGQDVIYGVTDVQYAIQLWKQWINQKEGK